MGVALALVLAFCLGASFMPANTPGGPTEAEAGDLAWSTIGIPSTSGSTLVDTDEDVGPVAISPNFANDHTVFAAINVDGTTNYATVAKSTNGGHTWSRTTTNLGTVAGDPIVAIAVSPDYASDSTLFVAVQDIDITGGIAADNGKVYRSTNGGATFTQLGVVTTVNDEMITSMDVSPNYDGVGTIAIGVANINNSTYTTATFGVQVWGSGGVLNWTAFGGTLNGDVTAVKFSPNYPIDSTLLAVVSNEGAGTVLHTRVGSNAWDATIGGPATVATVVVGADDMDLTGNTGVRYADIALPQDYNGTIATQRRAYVTWATDNVTAEVFGDVYRVTNVTTGTKLEVGVQLSDLDYNGTYAEGTLVGSLYSTAGDTNANVYRTTNPTSAVVNWYAATNRPAGLEATGAAPTGWLAMASDYADSSTVIFGSDSTESAFSISKDGAVTWNETGLIQNDGDNLDTLGDLELSPDYANDSAIYLLSNWDSGGNSDTALWRRTPQYGGNYWDMVHWADFTATTPAGTAGKGVIAISNEYATDSTVYFGNSTTTSVYYSGNGGDKWSPRTIATGIGVGVGTMAAPDATTLYVGDDNSGTVAKSTNSGWVWPGSQSKPTGATDAVKDMKVDGSTILIGCADGTVRRSDDGGTNWSKVATTLAGPDVFVAFDGTTVYAVESGTGDTFRSVDGGSWVDTGGTTDGDDAVDMVLAPDGTLYYAEVGAGQDVHRSINPTAPVPTPNVTFQSMSAAAVNITAMDVISAGSNIVAIIDVTPRVRMYTDILSAGSAGPTLVSPADGSTLTTGTKTSCTVELLTGVTQYSVYAATNESFTKQQSWSPDTITPPGVSTGGQTLTEGVTLYWRARATAPFNGPWSEVWTVETQLTAAPNAPRLLSPGETAGSTADVLTEPVFNWSAMKYATGYELQLSKDSGMTDLIAGMTGGEALGNVTSWKCTTALDYSTTYYWRVRAMRGTAASSDWSGVTGFTTMSKPVEPTPPVIIEPTPPAPAPAPITPAYIYAIIAIGAVLVIVVIVLIVRTRRIP
ncbi:hypothetical protein ES703_56150 [subsurface metagenome]